MPINATMPMAQSVVNLTPPEIESTEQPAPANEVAGSNPIYSMSPAGILQYCEDQMGSINSQFNQQVQSVQQMNSDSTMLGNLKASISGIGSNGLNMSGSNNPDETTWTNVDNQIKAALQTATQEGNSQLVASLTSIQHTFETDGNGGNGIDHVVSAADLTSITNEIESATSNITANQQIAMINVNQIASDLNSLMTQATQLIEGIDQTQLKIAGNA